MSQNKAIAMAEAWSENMQSAMNQQQAPLLYMVRGLLDHISRQNKDILELTESCRLLLRENKRIKDELSRSKDPGPGLDPRH